MTDNYEVDEIFGRPFSAYKESRKEKPMTDLSEARERLPWRKQLEILSERRFRLPRTTEHDLYEAVAQALDALEAAEQALVEIGYDPTAGGAYKSVSPAHHAFHHSNDAALAAAKQEHYVALDCPLCGRHRLLCNAKGDLTCEKCGATTSRDSTD